MPKTILTALAVATFVVFGLLLSIGIGISSEDQASDLESRVDELDSRVNDIEWQLR